MMQDDLMKRLDEVLREQERLIKRLTELDTLINYFDAFVLKRTSDEPATEESDMK